MAYTREALLLVARDSPFDGIQRDRVTGAQQITPVHEVSDHNRDHVPAKRVPSVWRKALDMIKAHLIPVVADPPHCESVE